MSADAGFKVGDLVRYPHWECFGNIEKMFSDFAMVRVDTGSMSLEMLDATEGDMDDGMVACGYSDLVRVRQTRTSAKARGRPSFWQVADEEEEKVAQLMEIEREEEELLREMESPLRFGYLEEREE